MVRRFSWCTAVALVVLLFVTTEGLRERGAQTDDHKAANRGTLKYNSKSPEEATTASSASSLSRSRTNRDRSVQSRRFSNIEGTTQASTINSESSSSESSIIRTTKRDSTSTATQVTDGSDKKVEEVGKTEPAVNRRNGKRYFPENDEETRSKDNEQRVSVETSRGISRRTSNGRSNSSRITERLDNKGPSVFLATTEPSRSRTGRKIQTTYSKKDLKTQLSTSRRHSNKKFENEFTTTSYRRGRSTTERIERSTRSGRSRVNNEENDSVTRRGPDTLLSESESVRVDIPLVVNGTGNRSTNGSSLISQRRSDTKESSRSGRTGSERSKNRGRSNDAEVAGSSRGSSGSRRGSSKFGDSTTTTEANELVVSSRRNTVSRDRSRSFEQSSGKKNSATESRSRSRGRNLENNVKSSSNDGPERDAKRKVAGERSSSERRSRVLDGVSRVIESRGQDGQDARGRSRNRSRPDVVTPVNTDVTTTVAPETTVLVDVTTIDSEVTTIRPTTPATTSSSKSTSRPSPTSTSTTEASGRGRGRGRGGRKQKEDFFNYGLGFRGRKPSPEGSSNATQPRKTILWKNDTPINGNPGWTLRRRPGNFNNTANPSRTIVPSSRDQTNEVIPPNDESTSTEVAATTTESSTTSSSRRGFKKLQTIDESSTVAGTTAKSYRRGNKTFGNGKATADREESDNYPPEFKARLTQLKNTNTKIPAPKTTSRTQLEEQERRIYGRRSRNNSMAFEPDDLETAASANVLTDESLVVNPLTLINGRGLRRVKKSSAALFAERSRMKLDLARRLVKPELNIEENDLDATTASSFSKPRATGGVPVLDETSKVTEHGKPAATASGGRSNRPSTSVESSREEVNVKSSRKDHEDSSKVTGRPNGLKKGRIIAERMVTSISIEERTAIEETTKPYVLSTNPSATLPAEQGSETVVDSSRIRLSGGRAGKKSKEEDSTIKNMKVSLYSTRRTESSDHVTTVKPKKPYVYQSRNTKFQLQEQSTAIEQRSTTPSPKKPYAPTHRKSQTSQQDDAAKKTKFSNSAGKPIFRPRYSKRAKEKSLDEKKTDDEATITAKVPVPTSRYSRKKSLVNSIDDGSITTERSATQTKKLEFRPRTATYRRHSEVPTTLIESSTKVDRRAGVAITPRSTKYHATLRTTTASPRSVAQEPRMSLKIANESASGIIDSSNGDTGNSNIFNPTRSTFLSGNNTLLEQLRSTVAPLLSSLGNKTPVFSESYSNVNNANSPARITPSGQPPRFSARYKGAELFVRKQNNIYQPTVPSITSSSTTPVTPVENSGSAPPIDISSPGEPRFLTLYQALESASIRNEQLLRNASLQLQEQRSDRVSQVDSNATAIANVIGDNVNNDTTSPTVATVSPQTPDTIANTTQDSTQTPRLSEDPENSTPPVIAAVPETPTTTDSVFTSAEPSSSTEQASTSAESLSSTEQISTSTDSSSTLEQISVRVGSVPVTEPASTESSSQAADETTTNVTDAEDVRNSTTNQELVSSTTDASTTSSVSEASSTELDVTSRVDVSETTTVTNTATTSENPEINTIPLSDVTVTQIADISSTDASTTEMDSNNANNVETTTTTSTSTIRTRLIDFAEDILSRLQATLSTTMLPSQDSTTTLPPAIDTEISNVVSGSNGNRSLESLSQLRDETTTSQGVTTDQSSLGTTEEVTTENAVGSITTSSSTMVPSREVDTQDELNAFTSTTPATTTTATVTQDSQTVSNTDSTIVRDSNDSSSPTLDVEVTTASIVTSTNDTLLTELMSIAKTLLSEEINSSQEATARQNSNVTSRLGDTMGNEIDRPSLSNDVLSTTTQATETSSVLLDVTTESVDSMSTTVVAPKSSTFFVDTPQNEDTTSTTAQRTAGSRIGQTTEISTPTIPDSSTTPSLFTESPTSSSPESSLATTTSFSVETTTATTTTETTTPTSIGRVPDGGTSTPQTTTMGIVTVTPLTETTTATTTTTVNIEENLVSTETTTSTSPASSDGTTATPTFTSTPGGVPTEATTTMSVQTTPGTQTTTSPKSRLTFQSPTTPYLGRFGGNRLTPAPRFSTSSSTRAPLRDYLVYGIYPNKTIVRKRPEDNLIDARNVDSPYVIFGIFPDGRLVRKFPNGTIIPDPPRRPVEVVFTLSTSTTTNRPPPRPYYNQANQGTYNQYRGPVYDNNGRPVAETTRNAQTPGTIDARLSGNAIVGPNGGGPDNTGPLGTPASLPSINETSNALLNTQMGTASVTPIVSTGRPPTDSQGGRIVQGRERDEATRTKEAGGQRSSVYIGQDKFVNYWTDGASTSNPRVLGVNINSVATATKEGPSPAVSSFENLLNNQPDRRVTAPPGFPWRDPLDQIFGITTSSPVITASVASNTLDDSSEPNGPISARPINPFVEVFTPFSNAIGVPRANIGSIPPPPPPSTPVASSTTPTPTTTMASPITTTITTTTTTIATTMAPTTITTMAPTISTVTARTTTPEPATTAQRPNIASQVETSRTSTSSQTNSLDLQKNLLNPQQQNAFGTTFDDLVFLNSLLQSNSRTTTQKTLTQVEQLLANKILELALKNPGPTRSPKAINTENPPPNSIYKSSTKSPSEPIIIELSSSSATSTPTWKSVETQQPTSQKPTISSATPVQVTWKPVTTTTTERIETSTVPSSTTIKTTLISTTKASVTVKAKPATTPRPKTTTQAPLGFAGLLWQTLLGGNIFGPSTTPKPAKAKPVPKTTQKAVNITPKPLQTTERTETTTIPSTTTLKTVDISKIQVSSPNSIINEKSVTTPAPISTTGQPLINNPNPRLPNVVTSTYSPEDDAKFLVELLRAVEQDNKIGSSKKKSSGLTRDDEAFLRAILSGRALTTPPAPPSTTEVGNAALLAALLKAQGIEPSTPANNIREQLQLASLGQSVTSTPATSPASESTTITTRPASTAANRPTDTTKKSVTPRPTSGPRTRTTIWSPSSTYPPPLFSSFVPVQSAGNNSGSSALIGATRAFSQFLGAAISGAAQQLQSLVRNGTRIVSEVVG
ncbi:mucin-19-like isoform X8 [Frieseomelitta varia]|uniref:mucin-19-like isoform X8 n=1 Tax=Frieseomelitta varia TaxID=561572 RepID=UPI001CB67A1A|nr:mucin-19-like isoform X8 [Frieseomelitta varia]